MASSKPRRRGIFWVLVIAAVACLAVAVVAAALLSGPSVPPRVILVLKVGADMPARPPGAIEALVYGSRGAALSDLYVSCMSAAGDPRVKGLCLDLTGSGLSLADARELRDLVGVLRQAGKRTVAYADDLTFGAWYLAAACDAIVLNPAGYLRLTGLGMKVVLLGGLLDKLGLRADLERVGIYKTAYETLTDTKLTAASTEALDTFLDSVWAQILEECAASRGLTAEALGHLIDEGPLPAAEAEAKGLVDALRWRTDLKEYLNEAVDPDAVLFPWRTYAVDAGKRARGEALAFMPLTGPILSGAGAGIDAESVVAQIDALRRDARIGAVVLRVDSPGGDALAAARIHHAVRDLRKRKPVVACMGASAASGGYYIASAADHIVAQPYTLTGSIGIFGGKIVAGALLEWARVAQVDFRRGRYAGMYDPAAPFDVPARAKLRQELEAMYARFVKDVADSRGRTEAEVEDVAQGRVITGKEAVACGLVDAVGGLPAAMAKAAELARVQGAPRLVVWPPPAAWYEALLARGADETAGLGSLRAGDGLVGLVMGNLSEGRPLMLLPFAVWWH